MVHLYYTYEQKRYYQNNADRAPAPQSRYRPEDHQGSDVSQRGETASVPHGPAIASHSERKHWMVAENVASFNSFLKNKFQTTMSKNKILYSQNGFHKFRKTFGDAVFQRIIGTDSVSVRSLKSWRSRKSYLHQFTA
ncbi:MAG: hypothetical protein JWP09_777 [Candidatus Taylorbacteria bacterium]|nr:hypothetical protein [Candidatus Taylorbacteria bacterium]